MTDLMQQQKTAITQWCNRAIELAWLSKEDVKVVDDIPLAAPDALFKQQERPLVVGLFGGTGVGKSSLLNRLAAEPIARASAERPTSRDISVYVHRSISVDRLPQGFPMERIRTSLHNNQLYQQVMFVDMPDFDSVDTSNRELVDLWLPHLDIVLYIVSPERYRDDQGWRLLLKHAHNHGWVFVFNHWDKGTIEQFEDFRGQLATAGLAHPLMFKTDCSTSPDNDPTGQLNQQDDFQVLQQTLIDLSEKHIVQSLQEQGVLSRLNALKVAADDCHARLADENQCDQLLEQWKQYREKARKSINETLQWSFSQTAKTYEEPPARWWQFWNPAKASSAASVRSAGENASLLKDQFDNLLENFINQQAQSLKLPVGALKHIVAAEYPAARQSVESTLNDQLNRSLATPGHRWQRLLYRATGVLCALLPVAAMAWIGWRVIKGFIDGATDTSAYLGSNFAINSALLVAIAWLVPAFAQNKCKPSSVSAALRGLNEGYETAFNAMSHAVEKSLDWLKSDIAALHQQYNFIWSDLPQPDTRQLPESVRQLIVEQMPQGGPQSVSRGLDVRANTQSSTDSAPVS